MLKQMFHVIMISVFFLFSACASLNTSTKETAVEPTLAPEFFTETSRIAVQDFSFAEGVKTDAFSLTDSAFLRSVIESKIVERSSLEVITRKDQGLLEKEMAYVYAKTANEEGKADAPENIKLKMGVDAFVHGIIYEYNSIEGRYNLTAAVKIVSTENGRIWQSKIISVNDEKSKYQLFDKLAVIVAQNMADPKHKIVSSK
jgi:hypothetical protein